MHLTPTAPSHCSQNFKESQYFHKMPNPESFSAQRLTGKALTASSHELVKARCPVSSQIPKQPNIFFHNSSVNRDLHSANEKILQPVQWFPGSRNLLSYPFSKPTNYQFAATSSPSLDIRVKRDARHRQMLRNPQTSTVMRVPQQGQPLFIMSYSQQPYNKYPMYQPLDYMEVPFQKLVKGNDGLLISNCINHCIISVQNQPPLPANDFRSNLSCYPNSISSTHQLLPACDSAVKLTDTKVTISRPLTMRYTAKLLDSSTFSKCQEISALAPFMNKNLGMDKVIFGLIHFKMSSPSHLLQHPSPTSSVQTYCQRHVRYCKTRQTGNGALQLIPFNVPLIRVEECLNLLQCDSATLLRSFKYANVSHFPEVPTFSRIMDIYNHCQDLSDNSFNNHVVTVRDFIDRIFPVSLLLVARAIV